MKDLTKTLIFAAVALVLTGAAALSIPSRTGSSRDFNDQGRKFFPGFSDPLVCTDLEVTDFDPDQAKVGKFEVKLKDGKWVVPSHFDYPADAKDRLAKTASGVMDLTKDAIKSDRAEDQEEMGVIDPLDASSTSLKGRGKRVTLRDKTEKVLADFIIGNEVHDRPGQRYVRVPGQKRIYGVNVNVDLSTKFADWIETNLLKLDASKVRRVTFDNHKVDPEQGVVLKGDVTTLERKNASDPWTIVGQGPPPPGQEMNADKLSGMTTALSDLKIVGVRTKPPWLSKDLKLGMGPISKEKPRTREEAEKEMIASRSLQSKGFYPTRDGRLYSNQGDVVVSTDDGVVYTLRYGEVFLARGTELSAGADESASKEGAKAKDDAQKKAAGATENRYLLLTATFDPSLLPPEHPPTATGPVTLPDDPFQLAPGDPKRVAEEKAAQEKVDRETAEHQRLIDEGEKRVKELTDRFADWYYVTPGDSFHAIALNKTDLTRPKSAQKPATPGMPNMPDIPGLPPGFKHP